MLNVRIYLDIDSLSDFGATATDPVSRRFISPRSHGVTMQYGNIKDIFFKLSLRIHCSFASNSKHKFTPLSHMILNPVEMRFLSYINWATQSAGDINMETWSSRLGVGRGDHNPTPEKVNS
jgi:hypothetical protein